MSKKIILNNFNKKVALSKTNWEASRKLNDKYQMVSQLDLASNLSQTVESRRTP
jgi:hypothetical protein